MIDIFSILLTHGLILMVGWRLLFREDLDYDDPADGKPRHAWQRDAQTAAPDVSEEAPRDA